MHVQRSPVELVLVTLMVLLTSSAGCVAQAAAVSGVVRDAAGVAQLGVLVQVAAEDASILGRAFTDIHGYYLVAGLVPGRYHVQATAALFAPALRSDLQLRAGARAVVNLTMMTLFDRASWLPAERRKADEPADDWAWTLRSAANRPILRMVENSQLVMVSSRATGAHMPSLRGRAMVTSGDGGFGCGGVHNVLTVDKAQEDGSGLVVRADTGAGRAQAGIGPSTELSAGLERAEGFSSTARTVVSFQSHPELLGAGGVAGLQTMQLATAQRTRLGDVVNLEVGGLLTGMHGANYGYAAQPFLRVMVEPAGGWSVGYRMASSRSLQGYNGLNTVQPEVPVAAVSGSRLRTEGGRHQEVSGGRKMGRGQMQVALYRDRMDRVALAGSGVLSARDVSDLRADGTGSTGAAIDVLTNSFRLLTTGYKAQGVNIMMTQPLGEALWAAVEFSTGEGLAAAVNTVPSTLPIVLKSLQPRAGQSAALALKGALPRSGTKIRAVYRWQPHSLVTPIDGYREFSDEAFLSFHLRQPVRWEGMLPQGLEASVDVTNLLAQGYQPFLSSDGRTLYLAETPRTLQAGLSINF